MINDAKLPLKEKFLEYYRELPIKNLAAAYIGRTDDTILIWQRDDSDFSELVKEAEANWAMKKCKGVEDSWILERVMKKHFSQRSEVTGADGEPVVFEIKRE